MNLQLIWDSRPAMLDGAVLTIEITTLALAIGLVMAVGFALMRVSANPLLRWPIFAYIFYFRGTPLLVQIFLLYYGSGQFRPELEALGLWPYFREAYFCAVLALTLNTAAYTAEILRGRLQGVPARKSVG